MAAEQEPKETEKAPVEKAPKAVGTEGKTAEVANRKDDRKYRLTFHCANNENVVVNDVGSMNDLSIALACTSLAIMLTPRIVGYRIVSIDDGTVVADCGVLDFVSAVTPLISKAMKQTIITTMNLKEGQKLEDVVNKHIEGRGLDPEKKSP